MEPARKISDEQHRERMLKRKLKRATSNGPHRLRVITASPPCNDGFDDARMERAEMKRQERRIKRMARST